MRKKVIAISLCILLLAGSVGCGGGNAGSTDNAGGNTAAPAADNTGGAGEEKDAEEIVNEFLGLMLKADYAAAAGMFNDTVLAMAGGEKGFMETLQQTGPFLSVDGEPQLLGEQGGTAQFQVGMTLESGKMTASITVKDGKFTSFLLAPAVEVEPPVAMPEGFVEEEITVDAGGDYPLAGRLVRPVSGEGVAAVLLVQGSGANGYDEIIGPNRVFGQLARGLAQRGVASLRYDKRTHTYPAIAEAGDFSVKEEYVEDVLAAVKLLKAAEGVDASRVVILGHSQGGMLAPMFITEGADVAGMILLAGSPRKFGDILTDQLEDNIRTWEAAGLQQQADQYRLMVQSIQEGVEAVRGMTEQEAKEADPIYGMGAYYLYMLDRYDAIGEIKALRKPTLILQGGHDMQVYADKDYALYEEALAGEPYARFHLYPGLGHSFMQSAASSLAEAQAEYMQPAEVSAEMLDDIKAWIEECIV